MSWVEEVCLKAILTYVLYVHVSYVAVIVPLVHTGCEEIP